MISIKWTRCDMTMVADFARPGINVTIAFINQVKVDMRSAIESLQMGFTPVHGQARFKKQHEPDYAVNFLTTASRSGSAPIQVENLGISLQLLKFTDWLLSTLRSCFASQ